MKKAAVLSIAAFYLLLTTGMFVCIVHCADEYFLQPKMAMHDEDHDDHEAHEHGKHNHCGDKSCGCCDKHQNYVIKENIKPTADFQLQQFALLLNNPVVLNFVQQYPVTTTVIWQDSNAPPWKSGKAISIQFRSLQI